MHIRPISGTAIANQPSHVPGQMHKLPRHNAKHAAAAQLSFQRFAAGYMSEPIYGVISHQRSKVTIMDAGLMQAGKPSSPASTADHAGPRRQDSPNGHTA